MPALLRRSLPNLPAVAAAGMGVVLLLASAVALGGIDAAVDRAVAGSFGRADFRVTAAGGATLTEETLVTIRSVLGVEVAAPAVEQPASLVPAEETPASLSRPVTLIGVDPILEGQVRQPDLAAGVPLSRRDEAAAVISRRLATEDDYGVGSDILVGTGGEPETFRVVGILTGDGPGSDPAGRTVVLPIDAVIRMFELEGAARVDLAVEDGIPVDGVRAELDEALAAGGYVVTTGADLARSLRSSAAPFADRARGVAALGAVVGLLLVAAAGSVAAGRRPAPTRAAVLLGVAVGTGLFVAIAMVGANAGHVPLPSPAALPGDLVRDALGVFDVYAFVATVVGAVGFVAMAAGAGWLVEADGRRRHRVTRDAALGAAGAVLGSVAGLVAGAAVILLAGGTIDPPADIPWLGIAAAIVLVGAASVVAAWGPARLGEALPSVVRRGDRRLIDSGRLDGPERGRRPEGT